MKQHQEIYRVAFESANSELIEIGAEFERLRARMAQVEKLVAALKPLVFEDENEAVEHVAHETTAESAAAESEPQAEKEAEPVGSDPFQHRINHVLGIGAGIRDVRSYTRQF